MSGVATLEIAPEDGDQRLDRWFKRHYPALGHGRLEKLLRTGQNPRQRQARPRRHPPCVRRPGPRAAAARSETRAGRRGVLLPPLADEDAAMMRAAVIYRDDDLIALNKPPGLPVQGGSRVARHLDGLLGALRFDADGGAPPGPPA